MLRRHFTNVVNSNSNNEEGVDLSLPYVTFEAQEANSTIGLIKINQSLQYSTDTVTWKTMVNNTTITLDNVGDKVYIRGELVYTNTSSYYTRFKMTGKIAATGNCNALWNYKDLNAPLKEYCGYKMFLYCTSLTTAPALPATELAMSCYYSMFSNCESLTIAPELPATTLAEQCYYSMFSNCESLTIAPVLPATTLTKFCYAQMFSGCTSLNYIKCLVTNIVDSDQVNAWVSGVSSAGTFVKHPDMDDWSTGTQGIPEGWTIIDAEI